MGDRMVLVLRLVKGGVIGLLAALGLGGCSALDALDAVVPDRGYQVERGIAYGEGPRRQLDVYRPAVATTAAPVILFFYGGGWEAGDRGQYRFVGQAFASEGFVVVIADYRLYPEVRFPGFVEDAAAAVAWTVANAARFGGDPARLHLLGHSAGAHVAAMLALDARFLAAAGTSRAAVTSVVGLAGPYAFEPTGRTRDILAVGGARSAMPIDHADGSAPPMLLLTGADDTTVYPYNTERLAARIRERGGAVEVIAYPGVGHARIVAALAGPLTGLAPVKADVLAHLRRF